MSNAPGLRPVCLLRVHPRPGACSANAVYPRRSAVNSPPAIQTRQTALPTGPETALFDSSLHLKCLIPSIPAGVDRILIPRMDSFLNISIWFPGDHAYFLTSSDANSIPRFIGVPVVTGLRCFDIA